MENVEDFEYFKGGRYDYGEANTTYIRKYMEENDWFTYIYMTWEITGDTG